MKQVQLAIIGGGPAGLSAAIAARKTGGGDIPLIERGRGLGGILNQCIPAGFGLHTFGRGLTRPEYAGEYGRQFRERNNPCLAGSIVVDPSPDRVLTVTGRETGLVQIRAQAVILAMGCRERPRGALNIPGTRPAGIYSAGAAQRLVNVEGLMPGRDVVILGSGDIGLIMARRMTLEGARVHAVAEVMPYSGGLKRNIVQCLEDFDIPLYLSTTVVDIHGRERLEAVTLAQVDGSRRPIPGTERRIPCDTLLLSVGLLPENELSREAGVQMDSVTGGPVVSDDLSTSLPGVFACGNVLHVHDLVDFVSQEAAKAGENAAHYILSGQGETATVRLEGKNGVRYTVPQQLDPHHMADSVTVRFRVGQPYQKAALCVYTDGKLLRRVPKRILTPGEMEQFTLRRGGLPGGGRDGTIQIRGGGGERKYRRGGVSAAPQGGALRGRRGGGCRPPLTRQHRLEAMPTPGRSAFTRSAPSPAPSGCWAARCRWCRCGRRGRYPRRRCWRWPVRCTTPPSPLRCRPVRWSLPTCAAPAWLWWPQKTSAKR